MEELTNERVSMMTPKETVLLIHQTIVPQMMIHLKSILAREKITELEKRSQKSAEHKNTDDVVVRMRRSSLFLPRNITGQWICKRITAL